MRVWTASAAWAHPRSRGENGGAAQESRVEDGSSPLTRGKPGRGWVRWAWGGLIPAHAGKTWPGPAWPWRPGAHPRSRGENDAAEHELGAPEGSSPLTRGKHYRVNRGKYARGLIPAHAGKTFISFPHHLGTGAHPRSRGENSVLNVCAICFRGSSPLTRGKRGGR